MKPATAQPNAPLDPCERQHLPTPSARFPRTRYQGSKRKLAGAIAAALADFEFTTVLDAFGGTGAVAYALKCAGKHVTYNDALAFNEQIGIALIENDDATLSDADIDAVGTRQRGVEYGRFIETTFQGIYFTDLENRWLDIAVGNIRRMTDRRKRAIAWFALFQAAMAKRPYNLFHRRNLYMRTADVKRSFGNKRSWDRDFDQHFRAFASEANRAIVDTGGVCRAIIADAITIRPGFDLVYIDPPYVNRSGVGVDYRDFYHFLEGLMAYDRWPALIDRSSKHLRLSREPNPWTRADTCHEMFRRLFHRFRDSILAVSYRSDGIPSIDELTAMLREVKGTVRTLWVDQYQYALSTNRRTKETLIIGTN